MLLTRHDLIEHILFTPIFYTYMKTLYYDRNVFNGEFRLTKVVNIFKGLAQ